MLRIIGIGLLLAMLAAITLVVMGRAFRSSILDDRAAVSAIRSLATLPPPAHSDPPAEPNLPPPVQRFLAAALPVDGSPPRTMELLYSGEIRLSPDGAWLPYTSQHVASLRHPAFVWTAEVAMAPGLTVLVRDKLLAGQGELRAAVWGAVPVAHASGPGIYEGALLRYLAELVWCPQALAPNRASGESPVRWTPGDAHSAWAELQQGTLTVRARFTFGPDGLVEEIFSPERPRQVGKETIRTPWRIVLRNHQRVEGLAVPMEADLSWELPEGRFETLRVRVEDVRYMR